MSSRSSTSLRFASHGQPSPDLNLYFSFMIYFIQSEPSETLLLTTKSIVLDRSLLAFDYLSEIYIQRFTFWYWCRKLTLQILCYRRIFTPFCQEIHSRFFYIHPITKSSIIFLKQCMMNILFHLWERYCREIRQNATIKVEREKLLGYMYAVDLTSKQQFFQATILLLSNFFLSSSRCTANYS